MSQPNFDFALGETADALRASVARFAAERIAPRAAAIDRDNAFPRDLWPQMGALGLLALTGCGSSDAGADASTKDTAVASTAATTEAAASDAVGFPADSEGTAGKEGAVAVGTEAPPTPA